MNNIPRDADSRLACKYFSCLLWNLKAQYCVYKSRSWASWIQSKTSHTNSHSFITTTLFSIFQIDMSLRISHLSVRVMHPARLILNFFFLQWCNSPSGPGPPHYRGFVITLRHTTLGRTSLDEWSARRTDLYLTTPNTHKRQTSTPPRRDSKPQSQQSNGRRPTPYTARALRSAILNLIIPIISGKV